MKKIFFALVLLAIGTGQALGENLTADQIVAETWRRYTLVTTEKETISVVITYKGGREEKKEIKRWIEFDPGKLTIVFDAPAKEHGTGILIKRNKGREANVWFKLPSLPVRRIPFNRQKSAFIGPDLTYEDVILLTWGPEDRFTYALVAGEDSAWVIAAVPKDQKKSEYSKVIFWTDMRSYAITKVQYFIEGRLAKTQTNEQITVEPNGLWRVSHVLIENGVRQGATRLSIKHEVGSTEPHPRISFF